MFKEIFSPDTEILSPDEVVFWEWGFFKLNATIVYTWVVMAILVIGSWLVTRRLSSGKRMGRWQNLLEVVVGFMRREIRGVSQQDPDLYLPFVGTLLIFIATSSILQIVPGFMSPTGSLSTTAALAACVFVAVPLYGVANLGLWRYLKNYIRPSPFMLPFNLIGELSRTLALAVRLFGNVMSGTKVVGILLSIVPFIFPGVMMIVGVLLGLIQAYIFAILTMVYISSGMRAHQTRVTRGEQKAEKARQQPATEDQSQGQPQDAPEKGPSND